MKYITQSITALILMLLMATKVEAAGLSVRVEAPKSPTNQKNFKLGFVALDINNHAISVVCEKKGPSDGSFTQFDSTKNLPAGGTSGDCQVTDTQISPIGTYEFRAVATSASGVQVSNIVSVDYDDSRPGKPENYSKEQIAECTYKITFKTANDSKTTKVEVYRSENTNFDLNNSTKIGEVALGPNQNGEFTNTAPDCSKTYYYALRAFDSAANTSEPVGDVTAGTINTSTTSQATPFGPIAVNPAGGQSAGQILGESDEASASSQSAVNQDTQSENEEQGVVQGIVDTVSKKLVAANTKIALAIGAVVVAALIYWWYRSRRQ